MPTQEQYEQSDVGKAEEKRIGEHLANFLGVSREATPASECAAQAEMPRYSCHKEVWALKIAVIRLDSDRARRENTETDGSAVILPADPGYGPFRVDAAYLRKHNPQVGGYFVVYEDGYKSFSPAAAFEKGYTRI